VDDFGLGREQLALEAGDDELPVRLRLAGIDRRIGAVEGVEQFVAELADEILKAQGQRGWIPRRAVRPVRARRQRQWFRDRGTW
jgi:hypothetical protein